MANELNTEMLNVALRSIDEFAERELLDSLLIELDKGDEFPEEIVRRMSSGDELGIQLLFVPYEFGGMGGGAFDVYRICERMASIDLGLATSELATFLGSDPIRVGGTDEQKRSYKSRIAKDGILFLGALGAKVFLRPPTGVQQPRGQRSRDRLSLLPTLRLKPALGLPSAFSHREPQSPIIQPKVIAGQNRFRLLCQDRQQRR